MSNKCFFSQWKPYNTKTSLTFEQQVNTSLTEITSINRKLSTSIPLFCFGQKKKKNISSTGISPAAKCTHWKTMVHYNIKLVFIKNFRPPLVAELSDRPEVSKTARLKLTTTAGWIYSSWKINRTYFRGVCFTMTADMNQKHSQGHLRSWLPWFL